MDLKALEAAMVRAALFDLSIGILAFAAGCWLMYWLTKSAVREGIKESGLIEALRRSGPQRELEKTAASMPDMRAD